LQFIGSSSDIHKALISFYGKLLFPLIPLLIVIYYIFWNKAGSLHLFNTLFSSVNIKKKIVVNLLAVCLFVFYWLSSLAVLEPSSVLNSLLNCFFALSVFLELDLHRNNIEDEVKISRSSYNIAPGLARSFFTVIEGVITGKIGGKSYKDSLNEYKKENRLDEKDWISNKVVILFLESDRDHKGSIQEIKKLERPPPCWNSNKVYPEEHTVVLENLTQKSHIGGGQPRKSVLNVVKMKTDKVYKNVLETKTWSKKNNGPEEIHRDRGYLLQRDENFLKIHQENEKASTTKQPRLGNDQQTLDEWKNNYVVIAENRPLLALHEMKNENKIDFTQADYELQYKLYYEELKRLIESNTETKEQVELYHYLDKSSRGEFSKHLIRIINEIKNTYK